MKHACIIGGGLTGSTVARSLAESGVRSTVFERAAVPGGLVRSAKPCAR